LLLLPQKKGASALILYYCLKRRIKGYVSPAVIGEARKNVFLKLDESGRKRLAFYLENIPFITVTDVKEEDVLKCSQIINPKDALILAAALKTKVSYLITLDRKDFLKPKVIKFARPIRIITPGEFVKKRIYAI